MLVVAIVRDRYSGREMARVMSLIIMVFIVVPVFAPAIGSLFLWLGGWRLIFISMLALAAIVVTGFALRMPETLHPEYRFPFSMRRILDGALQTVTTRAALGYATAMALTMGILFGYLNSSQQIFQTEVYGLGPLFPLAFGAIAAVLGVASFVNSKLVRRLGMRRLSHFGICGFILVAALLLGSAVVFAGRPPLALFGPLLAASLFLMSLMMVNFNAMAMEPLGAIAGTASSVIGVYTSLAGALLGLLVGQAFDGTVIAVGRRVPPAWGSSACWSCYGPSAAGCSGRTAPIRRSKAITLWPSTRPRLGGPAISKRLGMAASRRRTRAYLGSPGEAAHPRVVLRNKNNAHRIGGLDGRARPILKGAATRSREKLRGANVLRVYHRIVQDREAIGFGPHQTRPRHKCAVARG